MALSGSLLHQPEVGAFPEVRQFPDLVALHLPIGQRCRIILG